MRDLGPAHRSGASSICSARSFATSGDRASRTGRTASRSSTLPTLLWPDGHPYHHPVIGSHEDLEAASVADVKQFFATWYDPSNASLVVAGDFDPQQAKAPHRQELRLRPEPGQADRPGRARFQRREDDADERRPRDGARQRGAREGHHRMAVAAPLRAGRRRARSARERPRARQGESPLQGARLRPEDRAGGVGPAGVAHPRLGLRRRRARAAGRRPRQGREGTPRRRSRKVRDKEVTTEELERARNTYEMEFVDRLQGVEERASLLNMYQAETGDPGFVQHDLDRYRHASEKDLLAVREEGSAARCRRGHDHRSEERSQAMKRRSSGSGTGCRARTTIAAALLCALPACGAGAAPAAAPTTVTPVPPTSAASRGRASRSAGPAAGHAAAAPVHPAVARRVRRDQRDHGLAARASPGAARLLRPHGTDGRVERPEGQGGPRVHDREHARRGRREARRDRPRARARRHRRAPRHRRERRRELRLDDRAQAQRRRAPSRSSATWWLARASSRRSSSASRTYGPTSSSRARRTLTPRRGWSTAWRSSGRSTPTGIRGTARRRARRRSRSRTSSASTHRPGAPTARRSSASET